ncbi:MAG: hemolysin III family protein [Neisseriaceae bacterium]|nr:MAG: hemolysin III family protein [Neisseriaceae bacterium]
MKKLDKNSPEFRAQLFRYSLGEDIGNAVSHCVGAFIALGLLVSLAWIAGRYGTSVLDTFAFVFYGVTILFMFVMSTVYHSMTNSTARVVMKRLDHIAIFILILGSYTPFVFCLLKSKNAYIIYGIIFALTVLGTVFKAFYAGKFKKTSTFIFVLMGWLSVILLPQIIKNLPHAGVVFFVTGGLIYTIGAIIYALSKFKYSHMIWHIFVLLAAISMYISIAFYILQK